LVDDELLAAGAQLKQPHRWRSWHHFYPSTFNLPSLSFITIIIGVHIQSIIMFDQYSNAYHEAKSKILRKINQAT
jgi:hypothetical protein